MSKKIKSDSDLQGVTRIVTDVTIGITEIVEAMHKRIVHPSFLPSTPIQHLITNIAGITFKNIKWSTQFIGSGIDKVLGNIAPLFGEIRTTDEREAVRSALNGVVGDYLVEKNNPLRITMQFRHQAKSILLDSNSIEQSYSTINSKILLLVHGSCMNDIQWTQKNHNTPIYLHYNSGLHISTNGQNLDKLIEDVVLNWPVPVEELVIVAHSMGGLVSRSALYYGRQNKSTWTTYLKKIIFLGTPHHGAALERVGNYLDAVLELIPYTTPFARLGKIRSAGITDLRYGNLLDEDWKGNDRFEVAGDQRQHIPLPEDIECYSIAADIGKETDSAIRLLGDKLVSVKSALGQHKMADKNFCFGKENTWISYESTHMDLLSDPKIYDKIKEWLV